MIKHYIKIAFRNLLKYKTQSIISILGLAVGFTCFALSAIWIRHELTYDSFHEGSDRIYILSWEDKNDTFKWKYNTPKSLGEQLKQYFPEIEAVGYADGTMVDYLQEGELVNLFHLTVDWNFIEMFNIKITQESGSFRNADSNEMAITPEAAKHFFGEGSPIGKEINRYGGKKIVGALVEGWSKHSNIPFDALHINEKGSRGNASTYIKLKKGTDKKSFTQKLSDVKIIDEGITITGIDMAPLSSLRHSDYNLNKSSVKINYIFYFALLSVLVIICTLFNYLTLYISNLRMRGREMALRKVNGASNNSLFILFSCEFVITLFFALLVGLLIMELILPAFKELAGIHLSDVGVYLEVVVYIFIICLLSLMISIVPIHYFRKRTLQQSMTNSISGNSQNLFRKTSLTLQLTISIALIFCTVVMVKQLLFLDQTDGIERSNCASIEAWTPFNREELFKYISELPVVTEVLPMNYFAIIPNVVRMYGEITKWEGAPSGERMVETSFILADKKYADFYSLRLAKGEMIDDNSPKNHVLLNESAAKSFGWDDPIGKRINISENEEAIVCGVVKDFQLDEPTIDIPNVILVSPLAHEYMLWRADIIFKYQEGKWKECRMLIDEFIKDHYPDSRLFIYNTEDKYNELLKSEDALMKLLLFVSITCILISVFGIYSYVVSGCEKKSKEIAIRKVNGALISDILRMFFKEYIVLFLISCVVAFSVGYAIMKSWIESYVRQTTIDFYVYFLIMIGLVLIILLSIIQPIWKVAKENPAEVIKSE